MMRRASGIEGLDEILDGLQVGDNVVWYGGDALVHGALQHGLLNADPRVRNVYLSLDEQPRSVRARLGDHVLVVDARAGRRESETAVLERIVLEHAAAEVRVVFDLDGFLTRLGPERALGFFARMCPQLFDAGGIAYWHARRKAARQILPGVLRITQCVFDVADGRLRVLKAEGRPRAQGRVFRLSVDQGQLRIVHEVALGRLAEGLRTVRTSRQLSQSDLARIAEVSPSAISQAEAAHRGLGLETVLKLADGLGVTVDDLLASPAGSNYVIARRDRSAPRRGLTPLIEDPHLGLRAYLVHLEPGERGEPPPGHRGLELVLVAVGLVQIDMGAEGTVMRAGDAVLATRAPIVGWQNLLGSPARLFWILRD
jgi:transcriptional regulator with XRE-family HTH domain